MVEIHAFRGRTVDPAWLDRVPSPAYDSLSTPERRQFRIDNPYSYLNVTRAPEDEPPGAPTDNESLVAAARQVLEALLADGAFNEADEPSLYLYRIAAGDHRQTGIVCEASVTDYAEGSIKAHEQIRGARAELLGQHLLGVGHSSSPIALTFRSDQTVKALIREGRKSDPILAWDDGTIEQVVWRMTDPQLVDPLIEALRTRPAYIIDGHHRAAAALAVKRGNGTAHGEDRMLSVLFPDDALLLLGFNRVVTGLSVDEAGALVGKVKETFTVTRSETAPQPNRGQLGLYAKGHWHLVDLGEAPADPLAALDPVRLQDEILAPMLGISAPGSDPRLHTVSGDQHCDRLEQMVDTDGGVAFVVPSLTMEDLFVVADAGLTMPPKSTYFTPKVRSGVFLRSIN